MDLPDILLSHAPTRNRSTTGWTKFNAVCCVHNGHSRPDTRERGGIKLSNGGCVYYCFNCSFTATWKPGMSLTRKMRNLLGWMYVDDATIRKLNFQLWLERDSGRLEDYKPKVVLDFPKKAMPDGAKPFEHWCGNPTTDFIAAAQYALSRGQDILRDGEFWWSPNWKFKQRILIPFRWKGEIVGWTGRSIVPARLKYYSDEPANFLFNTDIVEKDDKYVIVVEGAFDAIAVGGIAVLTNNIGSDRVEYLKSLDKQIIAVPDRDASGDALVDIAVENGWLVSYPNWDSDIKDCSDAVKEYGKVFTLQSIFDAMTRDRLRITIERKKYSRGRK